MTAQDFPFPDRLLLRALSAPELAGVEAERQLYELQGAFRYRSPAFGDVVVPAGYVTDFASVPRPVWSYLSPEDPVILFPSLVHDYLYTQRGDLGGRAALDRRQCDVVLREAMLSCGARPTQAWVVFAAVRAGGGSHWR